MKINAALRTAQNQLEAAGIATARLDALVLLEDVLNTNRTQILADPDGEITEADVAKLHKLIQKRAQHTPLAYLRHKTEFYGRELYVDEQVLEPRPESETMIDMLKKIAPNSPFNVADIGSGSGALGITAALELSQATVYLLELDTDALDVSRHNVQAYNLPIQCVQSDLLLGTHEHFDVLLCNLPYVPDGFHINRAAGHEPKLAIFGGFDGLELYRKLFGQIADRASKPLHVLTESLPPQHKQLQQIAEEHGYHLQTAEDFVQHFRQA